MTIDYLKQCIKDEIKETKKKCIDKSAKDITLFALRFFMEFIEEKEELYNPNDYISVAIKPMKLANE